jgi:glycosyltransferase involved in cell wall biosynthesis
MPTYNGSSCIAETIDGLLKQSFGDFELIAVDDLSTDNTPEIVQSFKDPRIRFVQNEKNVGYGHNLERCRALARNDIVVPMGQDDIVAGDMLQRIHDAFADNPTVGCLTRAYYWFHGTHDRAVRAKPPVDEKGDVILRLLEAPREQVYRAFSSMDQLSGLAMRRKWMTTPVHPHIFTAHIHPMAAIWKEHDLMCIHDNMIAVRIENSQARHLSSIYNPSPMWTWAQMFETRFPEPEYAEFRADCIRDFVARNYVGLVQIRNFGRYSWLLREIGYLVKYRAMNLLHPAFWFYSLGCMIMPPSVLVSLVDVYKRRMLSRMLTEVGLPTATELGARDSRQRAT